MRFGQRRRSRALVLLLGVVALVAIVVSFGTPKAGCAWSADDDDPDEDDGKEAGAAGSAGAHSGGTAGTTASSDPHAASGTSGAGRAPAAGGSAPATEAGAAELFSLPSSGLLPVRTDTFCPTAGRVVPQGDRALRVEIAGMRGVIASDTSRAGELAFIYRGPSQTVVPLANGELRQQIGLKLRAQDTCNVVYVMWQIAPKKGVWVSMKANPGQATHAECADRGYVTPKPLISATPPIIEPDVPHTLRAEIDGTHVIVHADGTEVWNGFVPDATLTFDGAVGVRSDNGTFDFELRVPGGGRPDARCQNPGTELAH